MNIKQNLIFIITFGIIITVFNLIGIEIALWFDIRKFWGMLIMNLIIALGLVGANR